MRRGVRRIRLMSEALPSAVDAGDARAGGGAAGLGGGLFGVLAFEHAQAGQLAALEAAVAAADFLAVVEDVLDRGPDFGQALGSGGHGWPRLSACVEVAADGS